MGGCDGIAAYGTRLALSQEQVSEGFGGGDERVHRVYLALLREIAGGMLHSIGTFLLWQEDVRVLLSVGESDGYFGARYFFQRTFKENASTHIGLPLVFIKIYPVATTEVRQKVVTLVWHRKCYEVVTTIRLALLLLRYRQVDVYITCLTLFGKRHVPKVGSRRADSFLQAQTCHPLLAENECHHTAEIVLFKRRKAMKRVKKTLKLRQLIPYI